MEKNNYIFVNEQCSLDELTTLITNLNSQDFIAVDTEFIRVNTLFPILSIIQLSIKGQNFIVDVKSDIDLKDFIYKICASTANFLFFSADEDLDVLAHLYYTYFAKRSLPLNIVDLQLMPLFAGEHELLGLNKILTKCLNITISKDQTLSDWLMRPLCNEQLCYAVNDVLYLESLYHHLRNLISDENYNYFLKECQIRANNTLDIIDEDLLYLQTPGAGRLSTLELTRLRYLVKQRYLYAKEHDIALNWVVTNGSILNLVTKRANSIHDLTKAGVKSGTIRQNGQNILKWSKEAFELQDDPNIILPYDLFMHNRDYQKRIRQVRSYLKSIGGHHKIDESLFASKKLVANLFYAKFYHKPSILEQGWQWELCSGVDKLVVLN